MSISNELSSEIAVALFAVKDKYPGELSDLKELIFKVRSTSERLSEESRKRRDISHRFQKRTRG